MYPTLNLPIYSTINDDLRRLVFCLLCGLIICGSPTHAEVLFTSGNLSDGSIKVEESSYIAIVNDESASIDRRIEALEALTIFADPDLFYLFKDIAFRNSSVELRLAAIQLISSFIGTYRWNELCDTLADVVIAYPDESIRIAAVQSLKITVDAFAWQIPFDRNNVIDALISIVSPETYIKDPVSFFDAVAILSELGCSEDTQILSIMAYLNGHMDDYQLSIDIITADYEQDFLNKIGKTYPDMVKARTCSPLFNVMPENPGTHDYITAVAFMLDSAVTDSLGFTAIDWLNANGEEEYGDEGQRLEYLYNNAYRKRPDKAIEIRTALLPLLTKYDVGIERKHNVRSQQRPHPVASYYRGLQQLTVQEVQTGDRIALYDLSGKALFRSCATTRCVQWRNPSKTAFGKYIVTVNGQKVDLSIRR